MNTEASTVAAPAVTPEPVAVPNLWEQEAQLDKTGDAGVWVQYDVGVRLLIGSSEAPAYQTAMKTIFNRVRSEYRVGKVPEEVSKAAFVEVMATALLLGWEGMRAPDGTPDWQYTFTNAKTALTGLRRLKNFVAAFSDERANFASNAEAEKNS